MKPQNTEVQNELLCYKNLKDHLGWFKGDRENLISVSTETKPPKILTQCSVLLEHVSREVGHVNEKVSEI